MQAPISMVKEWDKTFELSQEVVHRKVNFVNRFGITLVADLYIPKNAQGKKLAAVAVSGPFGAVKEQSSGLYAHYLATQGLVALAFDPSYTGESGGFPRHSGSADIFTEDFSAAVDFLTTLPQVDAEKIGFLGIYGFGGFALNDAALDPRVKAVATSVMYDMARAAGFGVGPGHDLLNSEQRIKIKQHIAASRTADAQQGKISYSSYAYGFNDKGEVENYGNLKDVPMGATSLDPVTQEFADYYRNPQRGYHPRSINSNGI
ncbi:alpha/beta hydrolase [Psittacicella hinzii]|uniref:alpha/beta hydrolase n=1 Tax=Psittacicella hinzii TaxID=2028575 RepID=UPI001FE395BE|nr:alpha/beta hydrolase [Psittacicella hinzii]